MNGTISKVISDKGFGFIQGDDGQVVGQFEIPAIRPVCE
jgi:cold shock CspA family protein